MPPLNSSGKKAIAKPTLTNRGGAGLLGKLTDKQKAGLKEVKVDKPMLTRVIAKHRITPALQGMEVDINAVEFDPNNARLHPERNMDAIVASLQMYGQVKPIVVNAHTNIVVAGNGTLEAAKKLGWTTIAATFVEMSEVEAAGYGLADNRTAELARWDFEVIARLDKMLQEQGHENVGWTVDELQVLRAAEWTPPEVDEGAAFSKGEKEDTKNVFDFDPDEMENVQPAVDRMRAVQKNEHMSKEAALRLIAQEWLKAEEKGVLDNLDEMDNETARANGLSEEG